MTRRIVFVACLWLLAVGVVVRGQEAGQQEPAPQTMNEANSQEPAPPGVNEAGQQEQAPPITNTPPPKVKRFEGTVVANRSNDEIFVKQPVGGYLAVRIGKAQWPLKLTRGCEVVVEGVKTPDSLLGNEVEAYDVRVVKRGKNMEMFQIRSIEDIRGLKMGGEEVLTRGAVTQVEKDRIRITDGNYSIWVPIVSNYDARKVFELGQDLVVLGLQIEEVGERKIDPIAIRPISAFIRPNEPGRAEKLRDVLLRNPVGQMVKTTGRIAVFIGPTNANLLTDGKDMMILYLSEQYLSMYAPAGTEVTAVGIYDVETQRGRRIGVLRDARIDRFVVKRQVVR